MEVDNQRKLDGKKRAPRHYYSKDSPEMKNIFAVTSKGLDFNRDYTMMTPGKLTKFVQKHPGYSWKGDEDLDGDQKKDIVLYNSYGEPVYFNGLHIGRNTKTRNMYDYYNSTFNPQQPFANMRTIDGKKNENYISFTDWKEMKPQRPDKEMFKPVIKELYDYCIEHIYEVMGGTEEEKKSIRLQVMRACPFTAFYAFIVKYCIKFIYANGNIQLLEDKKFLKQVNDKLKTMPRSQELANAFTEYFNNFVWKNIGNETIVGWFDSYINKNEQERQQACSQIAQNMSAALSSNPQALASIKSLLGIN